MTATAEDERVRTATTAIRPAGALAAPRLLEPVRRGMRGAALASAAVCGVLVAVDGRAQPGRSALALAALAGLALLWLRGPGTSRAAAWAAPGEAALLGTAMLGAARPAPVLALAYVALYHRGLHAGGRRVGLATVTYLCAVGAGAVAAGHAPVTSAAPALHVAAFPLVALLAALLARLLWREERAAGRELALDELRARLLGGGGAPVSEEIILCAARRLLDAADARVVLLEPRGDSLAVRAVAGAGAPVDAVAVPAGSSLRNRLSLPGAVRAADLPESARGPLDGLLGPPPPGRERLLFPLAVTGVGHGVLLVEQRGAVSGPETRALERLAAGVAVTRERDALTHALRHSENRFASLIRHCTDVIAVLDADLVVRYVTPSVRRLLDRDPADLVDTPLAAAAHPNDRGELDGFLQAAAGHAGATATRQGRLRRRDGTYVPVEVSGNNLLDDTDVAGLVLTLRDITERLAFEEQLAFRAFHDPLTDLANRALLGDRIEQALARARRGEGAVALLLVDLDDFKDVNDRYGHAAGDALLAGVAERLRRCSRAVDTPARIGGDEFALLLDGISDGAQAQRVARRLLEVFAGPVDLGPVAVPIRGSIGVAVDADGRGGADELLRRADAAMYAAKAQGKGDVAGPTPATPAVSAR